MTPEASRPCVAPDVFIAPTAWVGGNVTIGAASSVWHHVTIRGDVAPIRIGQRVNIQDGTVIHTKTGVPLEIEDDVSIGHRAVVHCRRVGAGTLIGIGAIVLDDAEIGPGSIIAAGALVPPGTRVPSGVLVVGMPGRVRRELSAAEREYLQFVTARYLDLAGRHAAGEFAAYERREGSSEPPSD
ncbi:MAG: gamma carbonic anhydrase family protein [Phycisphaerales bacterium]|nr:gamma carbonic anhydrase family protein [Phycisphaerales bacterium]